ncbi:4-alpha-glucanotransferase [Fusobacterium massiliense]|uniref:4-alpha-glucanotransferase n=1 Tax=Fusobacterium massiliense TaxID=1852365 RepID=UPI00093B6C57|nr:4-alpha-glucanotransferase [Fusobacterium massiliense]
MNREAGVLLAISSLPSPYGIGDLGEEAYRFVDFLKASGQKLWQILPLCPIEYGNSPYQSPSTFAWNFLYIDLEELVKEGYLNFEDINELKQEVAPVNYDVIKSRKEFLLKKASMAFFCKNKEIKELQEFQEKNKFWLEDYSIFLYLNKIYRGKIWNQWDRKDKVRDTNRLLELKIEAKEEYKYQSFIQYYFYKQWKKLKEYANENSIKIVGDLPIYVATHSSDTWKNPELFMFDKHLKIESVAGCPPDYFSKDGQLWGNVLYNWKEHEKTQYEWWTARIKHCSLLYDVLRLDHFRGFASYWSVKYGDKTAAKGKWKIGPRYIFFKKIENKVKNIEFIAEDLGTLTPDVFKLLKQTQYANIKVLQFGMAEWDNMYQPKNYPENCVAYTGTHDNMTIVEWYENLSKNEKFICDESLKDILEKNGANIWEPIQWRALEVLYSSKANKVIIPLQDILGLGKDSRMNTPSTVGKNWEWRVYKNYRHPDLENKLNFLVNKYNRNKD